MPKLPLINIIFLFFMSVNVCAQKADSTLDELQQIPANYITGIDKKITQYTNRITTKTEKTLTKLSRWENKIKGLLQKASPETAERLFGNNQLTFTTLLQQFNNGEDMLQQYQAPYNKYRDNLTSSLKYIAEQKEQLDRGIIKKVLATKSNMQQLSTEEDKAAVLQQFIKERKKQLIEQAFLQIGKSKYFLKINKEAYYYAETLKNYKELFSDSKKAEETAKNILSKIPAFQKFVQQNSQLAALFGQVGGSGVTGAGLGGLQTRASIQALVQDRIASGGPNAQQAFSDNITAAKEEINKLKEKLMNAGGGSSANTDEALTTFKPNMQKTKTFSQRMEYGFNLQFTKSNNVLPGASDIGLSVGFRINDKSVLGVGASYKLGIGNIQHINFTHEGVGLRSFIEWRLKKQLFISGGYELNHNASFKNFTQLKNYEAWQGSALLGLTKKINIKTKWFKAANLSLLYDFLSRQHLPVSQPVLFRVGYSF